ncbi:NADH:ubiquinone reductase (Na(+)-transporting) subunit B [Flavobacteriales bacterium]|nr:NADH:ubiquinone reductase (Na(+)-transporting) subunit B [Flavobacteriales bacterium]MDB9702202.1 NADH:ubiquinone reductase (Na(+)-transporting) subunit B [Flavobacteriales bacterium]
MQFLRNFFDKAYEKTGEKFHPVVESFDTILFSPNHTTKSGAHVRDAVDLKRTMMFVILAMVPCLLFGMWNVGEQHFIASGETVSFFDKFLHGAIRVLPLVVVSYGVGLTVEFIFGIIKGHSLHEGYLVSGMLIPLIMPVETPLWMVAIAVVFGVVIGKEVFGGTGMNILNVALTTRAFLFFAHPNSMIGDKIWISQMRDMEANGTMADGVSGATPLGQLATMDPGTVDTYYANGGVDFSQSLMGNYLGSIGETSVYAILLGLAFLLITRVASWRIVVSFFAGGFAMAFIFNIFAGDNVFMQVPALSQLMLGSFMFGMVFMITDPVTAAQTNKGKFYYGFLAGFIGILIRVANPAYPEGIMLGILIANVCASLIDHMVINANIKRREKRLAKATA